MTVHIAPVGLSIIGNLAKIEKLKFVEEPAGPNPIEQDFPWTELIKQVQASGYLESIYPGKKAKRCHGGYVRNGIRSGFSGTG